MSENPLSRYFRQPGRSINLPTNGKYNKPEDIEFENNGEVRIFPPTKQDEINLLNPDNLLNGSSTKSLILSCCPNVKNYDELCVIDYNAIFVGIKLASGSKDYKTKVKCPSCSHENILTQTYDAMLTTMKFLPENMFVRLDDNLIVNVKPYSILDNQKMVELQYSEQMAINIMRMQQIDDTLIQNKLNEYFFKATKLKSDLLINSIVSIFYNNETITNKDYIKEFLDNAPANLVSLISKKCDEMSDYGITKTIDGKCENCNNDIEAPIILDPSDFLE